jgi:hypothetical protein
MLAGRRDDEFVRAPLLVPWGEADLNGRVALHGYLRLDSVASRIASRCKNVMRVRRGPLGVERHETSTVLGTKADPRLVYLSIAKLVVRICGEPSWKDGINRRAWRMVLWYATMWSFGGGV